VNCKIIPNSGCSSRNWLQRREKEGEVSVIVGEAGSGGGCGCAAAAGSAGGGVGTVGVGEGSGGGGFGVECVECGWALVAGGRDCKEMMASNK
jgi:hypothetical protein